MGMGKPQKSVRDRIRQRPVRVAGVVLALLMWLLAVIPGEEPSIVVQGVTFLAPVIAALITERFTFSQSFLNQIMELIRNYGTVDSVTKELGNRDRRLLPRGTNYLRPRDGGISVLEAVLVLFVILVILFVLFPGIGRR